MAWSIRAAAMLAAAVALTGCTLAYRPARLSQTVGEDTVGYSVAYARAANNQILLNILQARDRLPRHYLTVSGIADAPSTTNSAGVNVAPLPLGNPFNALSGSSANGSTSQTIHPSYGVTPLNPDRLLKAIYAPMPREVFEYYWANSWPRDVLLHLFVLNIRAGACSNLTAASMVHDGEVNVASKDAGPDDCVFVEEKGRIDVSALVDLVRARDRPPAVIDFKRGGCSTVMTATDPGQRLELLKIAAANRAYAYREDIKGGPARLESCGGVSTVALVFRQDDGRARLYVLELRSLDQVTYWLGGRVREGGMPLVRPPGYDQPGHDVPLFQVQAGPAPQGLEDDDFAAALTYRGVRYRAGVAVDCEVETTCRPEVRAVADRSGTVLSLLAQLYDLAPAPESLTPPTRFVLD